MIFHNNVVSLQPNFCKMKRLFFILVMLLSVATWSCKDDSGEFIQQMRTDAELTKAARACLTVATDTAVAHVCVSGGMTATGNHISFPNSGLYRAVRDTLTALGRADLLDTLYNRLDRAGERMGDEVTTQFKAVINKMEFDDPSTLVYSESDTLTSYFRLYYENSLRSGLSAAFASDMQSVGATSAWNEIVTLYNGASAIPLSLDVQTFALTRFLNAVFAEISKEELLIRKNESHRVTETLENFFGEN